MKVTADGILDKIVTIINYYKENCLDKEIVDYYDLFQLDRLYNSDYHNKKILSELKKYRRIFHSDLSGYLPEDIRIDYLTIEKEYRNCIAIFSDVKVRKNYDISLEKSYYESMKETRSSSKPSFSNFDENVTEFDRQKRREEGMRKQEEVMERIKREQMERMERLNREQEERAKEREERIKQQEERMKAKSPKEEIMQLEMKQEESVDFIKNEADAEKNGQESGNKKITNLYINWDFISNMWSNISRKKSVIRTFKKKVLEKVRKFV